MAVEQPEAETESQQTMGMPRIWGASVEPRALANEAEVRRSAAELERLRTQVEPTGGRSPTEPVGWSDEASHKRGVQRRWRVNDPNQGGTGGMREPVRAGG